MSAASKSTFVQPEQPSTVGDPKPKTTTDEQTSVRSVVRECFIDNLSDNFVCDVGDPVYNADLGMWPDNILENAKEYWITKDISLCQFKLNDFSASEVTYAGEKSSRFNFLMSV